MFLAVVMLFCGRYYSVYDSGDRQKLLGAYHDGARFSLSLPLCTDVPRFSIILFPRVFHMLLIDSFGWPFETKFYEKQKKINRVKSYKLKAKIGGHYFTIFFS